MYSEPNQTSGMKAFAERVNGFQSLNVFDKMFFGCLIEF